MRYSTFGSMVGSVSRSPGLGAVVETLLKGERGCMGNGTIVFTFGELRFPWARRASTWQFLDCLFGSLCTTWYGGGMHVMG